MNRNKMKNLDYRIVSKASFKYEEEWIVDIEASPKNDCYEFWLRHIDYGYKMMMFGIDIKERLMDYVNLIPELIEEYRADYEEEMRP